MKFTVSAVLGTAAAMQLDTQADLEAMQIQSVEELEASIQYASGTLTTAYDAVDKLRVDFEEANKYGCLDDCAEDIHAPCDLDIPRDNMGYCTVTTCTAEQIPDAAGKCYTQFCDSGFYSHDGRCAPCIRRDGASDTCLESDHAYCENDPTAEYNDKRHCVYLHQPPGVACKEAEGGILNSQNYCRYPHECTGGDTFINQLNGHCESQMPCIDGTLCDQGYCTRLTCKGYVSPFDASCKEHCDGFLDLVSDECRTWSTSVECAGGIILSDNTCQKWTCYGFESINDNLTPICTPSDDARELCDEGRHIDTRTGYCESFPFCSGETLDDLCVHDWFA